MKRIQIILCLALCALMVLSAGSAFGQKKIKDLKYPPLGQIEVPKPDKIVMDNGLTLYLLEDHTLPLLNLSARMACGSYLEPAPLVGLAELTGSVMRTGGTDNMSGDEIDETLEGIGASVETSIGSTSGFASANALSEHAETILRILSDVLRRPVFDPDKIDLAKTEARAVISRRNDEPMGINVREFLKLIYGPESPYARHTEYATIEAITRDDMLAFHKAFVRPNGTQLAIWGDFNRDEMIALVKQYFGDWESSDAEIPKPPEVDYTFKPTVNYAEKTDVNQSNIFIGHIGGKMGDPDYPATVVMNSILGGAFGSRLFNEVRSKEGLAYAVSGTYTFNFDHPGFFYVFCSTKSESTVKAIQECMDEIRKMQTDPPTEEEMRLAKDGYLNSFVFNFDTKGEVINRMMTYDYYDFPADYLQQVKTAVEKVTPEDVVAVAKRKLNPDALQIMVTGKGEDFGTPLSTLGEVNVIDISIPGPAEDEFAANEEELSRGMELLARTVEATGGLKNYEKVNNVRTTAKVTITLPQGAMTVNATTLDVFPNMAHQVMKTPMGEQAMVFNGKDGWMSMGEQSQALPEGQVNSMKDELARNRIWIFKTSAQPAYKVAFKGEADFGGKKAYRLDFLTERNTQFQLFIDPEGYLPVGMQYIGETMAGPGEVTESLSGYQKAGGIMLPGKVSRDANGTKMEVELVKGEINVDYDPAMFAKPGSL